MSTHARAVAIAMVLTLGGGALLGAYVGRSIRGVPSSVPSGAEDLERRASPMVAPSAEGASLSEADMQNAGLLTQGDEGCADRRKRENGEICLRVKNATPERVWMAVLYRPAGQAQADPDPAKHPWVVRAWYVVEPGAERPLVAISGRKFYYFAQGSRGSQWSGRLAWPVAVGEKKWTLPFRRHEAKTGTGPEYTLTITDPREVSTDQSSPSVSPPG